MSAAFLQRCTEAFVKSQARSSSGVLPKICVLLLPDEEEYLVMTHQLIKTSMGIAGLPCYLCNDESDLEVIADRFRKIGYEILRPRPEELDD